MHNLCIFEDAIVGDLEPLSATRPVFDLVCGMTTLAAKQQAAFRDDRAGVLVRPELVRTTQSTRSGVPVNDAEWLASAPVLLVNGRWLPSGIKCDVPAQPGLWLIGGEVAYAYLHPHHVPAGAHEYLDELFDELKRELPVHAATGQMVRYPWDLVAANADAIEHDFQAFGRRGSGETRVEVRGPLTELFIDPTARLDPFVMIDTTAGPVVIEAGVSVAAFTRIEGPCYVGPHSQLHGAKVRGGTTIGPHCRLGGEIEASIILGHSNKYHDGFLGHSYLGEWINLGAGTQTSDLRNDYGPVTMIQPTGPVATGSRKVGSMIGDHVKSGLGVLLNTGTHVGPFAQLLPTGRLLPKYIPAFARYFNGAVCDDADLTALLSTAGEVMQRRGVQLDDASRTMYESLYAQTASHRRQSVRDAEVRRLRGVA